jgi:putative endonuclease
MAAKPHIVLAGRRSNLNADMRQYYVYIITNKNNNVLYTGITGDLLERVQQHRSKSIIGFTKRYNVTKLVYFETYDDPVSAILREKQIKGGSRKKKIELVESMNKEWKDLFEELVEDDFVIE